MNIVLTGFMGTGKSVVGKRIARRIGWKFVDVDEQITLKAKMSIPDIFEKRSERVFRRFERECIARIVKSHHQVIATGGGAFVDESNRELLKHHGYVICLSANPDTIVRRVGRRAGSRPLLKGHPDPRERIEHLYAARIEAYSEAHSTIDTDGASVDEVVERVWEAVSPLLCQSWQYLQKQLPKLAKRFAGKYVVVMDKKIVGSGKTQLAAYKSAAEYLSDEREAGIYYIPLPEDSMTALLNDF